MNDAEVYQKYDLERKKALSFTISFDDNMKAQMRFDSDFSEIILFDKDLEVCRGKCQKGTWKANYNDVVYVVEDNNMTAKKAKNIMDIAVFEKATSVMYPWKMQPKDIEKYIPYILRYLPEGYDTDTLFDVFSKVDDEIDIPAYLNNTVSLNTIRIRYSTVNCENKVRKWNQLLEEILKKWWAEDGLDLPSADDPVVECYIDENKHKVNTFKELITELNILYWSNKSNCNQKDIDSDFDDEDFTLYKQTKDILQKRGYQIKKLDLCKPQDSCTYNPLMYTKTERDVLTVANFILNATTDKNATGTVELEKAKQLLLLTCIYYVLENETDKTLLQVKGTLDCFLKMDKISDKPGFSTGLTAEYYKRFLELDEELRYSVIISTYFHLFSFLSPKISSVVCSDDVHLDKFMEEKTVLFVNSKKIDVSSKTTDLSGLLYHQMCSIAENNAINHIPFTYRVTLLIDDITCYEDITYFVYWIEYGKGYGISITATLQSLEQLNCAYEETCIAILEHIDKLVFLSDDFLLCFDKQLSKYLEFKYGNGFLSELEDMTKEEIMVCITDKAYKILQRKENLWQ